MTRNFLILSIPFVLLFGGVASAAEPSSNGLIRGFRYTDCRKGKCLMVNAPKAWMSSASGGFIAEAAAHERAQVEVLRDGKSVLRKSADEAVLRPEVDLLTFENSTEVIVVELSTLNVQVVKK